jgi:NADPH2:quinone reductase
MRKVVATSLDSIADYRIVETERPRPGSGEILLKVAACGVGYVDALVALGRYQVKPPLPHTPGQEVAGWVAEIGTDVAALKVGDTLSHAPGGASPSMSGPRRPRRGGCRTSSRSRRPPASTPTM